MEPFAITTDRLVLRPFHADDVGDVYAYARDDAFGRYVPTVPSPYRREHAEEFVSLAMHTDWTRSPHLAVTLQGRVIGAVSLGVDDAQTAELGYAIGRSWWSRGYASEVARAAVDCAFTRYDVAVVWATTDARNVASQRVLAKIGMRLDGTLRQRRRHRGERCDERHFSVLRPEWQPSASPT